jgi:hypothetical protein
MLGIQIIVVLCVVIAFQVIIQRFERRRQHRELLARLDKLEALFQAGD